jgi:hypothetical protein
VAEHRLSLAVNGREKLLYPKLSTFRTADHAAGGGQENGRRVAAGPVAIPGLGYAGAGCKAGVRDLRESPALAIMAGLLREGASAGYYDPLLPVIELPGGQVLASEVTPAGHNWDLAVARTLHPGTDCSWAYPCPRVLDGTYQFFGATHRAVA